MFVESLLERLLLLPLYLDGHSQMPLLNELARYVGVMPDFIANLRKVGKHGHRMGKEL